MTVAVFFPSLMGVGILVSGALLISDWVRRLLPQGSLRRKHHVIIGTYGSIAETVDAAGYHLEEPWFLKRGLRERSTYLMLAVGSTVAAVASSGAGRPTCTAGVGCRGDSGSADPTSGSRNGRLRWTAPGGISTAAPHAWAAR